MIVRSALILALFTHVASAAPRRKSLREVDWQNHTYAVQWSDKAIDTPFVDGKHDDDASCAHALLMAA